MDSACRRVFESPLLDRQLEVAWHGGEPLTVPLSWYEKAMAIVAERRPDALQLKHRFQTNGLLLDDGWVRFFARTGATIGLSIDGPAHLHDASRRTRSGHGTHKAVMRAVRLLQENGLAFHVITVLTERALDDPDGLFDFYGQNGIKEVGFNIEEIEGVHSQSSLASADVETRFRRFVKRLFELVCNTPGLLAVREFESTVGLLLSNEPAKDEQNLAFAIVSVSHDGTLSTFSPELLGAHHPRFGTFALGHVMENRLSDLECAPLFRAINNEIRQGLEACERTCRYFRWCGGGAPANKLFETGRFDTTETMHCRLTRQVVLDEVIEGIQARIGRREIAHDLCFTVAP